MIHQLHIMQRMFGLLADPQSEHFIGEIVILTDDEEVSDDYEVQTSDRRDLTEFSVLRASSSANDIRDSFVVKPKLGFFQKVHIALSRLFLHKI